MNDAPEVRRYAFVGTGHRAELYFAALLGSHADVGRPVALCDVNHTRMGYYNDLWTKARPRSSPLPTYEPEAFGAMLATERPDAVVVTTIDRTHHVFISEALRHGCDVITEKPLTTDASGCRTIVEAVERSAAELVVTFNYRYAPRNAAVRQLVADGQVGTVTSVHFEWVLDTVHGADYFRRWHRDKTNSGGLLVHKATHHFDLVNWWVDAVPDTVFAFGDLRFYGRENAALRGLGPRPVRSHGSQDSQSDPFAMDLAEDVRLKKLYLEAEHEDGYHRDLDVFGEGISIEDNMSVLVRYADRALLTYSLNAHAPWEGYRVAINGTHGRIELSVCERSSVEAGSASSVVGHPARPAVDPSATEAVTRGATTTGVAPPARTEGTQLLLQRHWEPARRVEIPEGTGGHGGGDTLLLDDMFRGGAPDPLGRRAGYLDGVRSVLVGAAANEAIETGRPVRLADFGIRIDEQDRKMS